MRVALLLAGAAAILPASAVAQTAPDPDARIAVLEAQVKLMTEQIAELKAERATHPATPAPATTPAATTAEPNVAEWSLAGGETRGPDGRATIIPTSLDRTLQNIGAWAEINATSDSSQVSIKLGGLFSDPNLRGRPAGWAHYDTWSVTGSAPLGKARTDLGTLDGFTSGAKLKVNLSRFQVMIAHPEKTARGKEIMAQARAECTRNKGEACDASIAGDEFIRTWLGKTVQTEYLKLAFPASFSWAYGAEGSIGYTKYNFLDAAGTSTPAKRVPWGAKGFVSLLPGGSLTSWTGAIEFQRTFKEKDVVAVCTALAATPVTCPTGPGGLPVRTDKLLGSVEYRHLFDLSETGFLRSLGLSVLATYDAENNDYGVDVPIYLLPNDKGQMIGGVRFGYTSTKDGHDFVAGIFVGTAFSLFQ
ncbi:MAG: hypothetical protein JWR80_7123 [Bradyrhizobium sp.]|nr:hypothetical protein [Bradyrhizobium sp.]